MAVRRHWSYFKYVVRHKWFVMVGGFRLMRGSSLPVSKLGLLWRLVVHDMSKFLPSEWFPYARALYGPDGAKKYLPSPEFDVAIMKHYHRNAHHWVYWLLSNDSLGDRYTICDMGDFEGLTHIHDKQLPRVEATVPDMDLMADRPEVCAMMRELVGHANVGNKIVPQFMPLVYVYEMIADWMGASRAIRGKWGHRDWYMANRHKIKLNPFTRKYVDYILGIDGYPRKQEGE